MSKIEIRRTENADVVRAILEHPEVRPYTWDKEAPPPVPNMDYWYYLLALNPKIAGMVCFIPETEIAWESHIAVLPPHGRGIGAEVMGCALSWMYANTSCRKVKCSPLAWNARAVRMLEKCGFRREGLQSLLWRGELVDRVQMGTEKELEQCLG